MSETQYQYCEHLAKQAEGEASVFDARCSACQVEIDKCRQQISAGNLGKTFTECSASQSSCSQEVAQLNTQWNTLTNEINAKKGKVSASVYEDLLRQRRAVEERRNLLNSQLAQLKRDMAYKENEEKQAAAYNAAKQSRDEKLGVSTGHRGTMTKLVTDNDRYLAEEKQRSVAMYIVDEVGGVFDGKGTKTITGFSGDAVNVTANATTVRGVNIVDSNTNSKAHSDGIQLIAGGGWQFAGTPLLEGVTIASNTITSGVALQPIFSSDGLFRNLTITGNSLQTKGEHFITINGLLSGRIEIVGNSRVQLYPWRLGGNPGTCALWVLSFAQEKGREHFVYGEISGNVPWGKPASNGKPHLEQRNRIPIDEKQRPQGIGLENFPYWAFLDRLMSSATTLRSLFATDPMLEGRINQWLNYLATAKDGSGNALFTSGTAEQTRNAYNDLLSKNLPVTKVQGGTLQGFLVQTVALQVLAGKPSIPPGLVGHPEYLGLSG